MITNTPWITRVLAAITVLLVAAVIGVLGWSVWDTNVKRLELFEAYKSNIDACLHVDGCEVVPDGITTKITCFPSRDNRGNYWILEFRNGSELRVFDTCTPNNVKPDPDFGGLVPQPSATPSATGISPNQDNGPAVTDIPDPGTDVGQPAAVQPATPADPAAPAQPDPAPPVFTPAPDPGLDDLLCGVGICVFQRLSEPLKPVVEPLPTVPVVTPLLDDLLN